MWNPFKKKEQQPIEPKSREELIELLKEISNDTTEYEKSFGAMCYCPAPARFSEVEETIDCEMCMAHKRAYRSHHINRLHGIVDEMCKLGYDAKIEILCMDCLLSKLDSGNYSYDIRSFDCAWNICNWDSYACLQVNKDYLSEEEIKDEIRSKYENGGIFICFLFRTSPSEKYHIIQEESSSDYRTVLSFLQNKKSYLGSHDETHLLREEIEIIEKMTGLSVK